MSSGHGAWGGHGRCYPFWQDFAQCQANAQGVTPCVKEADDYFECLHHKKQILRMTKLADQYQKYVEKNGAPPAAAAPQS